MLIPFPVDTPVCCPGDKSMSPKKPREHRAGAPPLRPCVRHFRELLEDGASQRKASITLCPDVQPSFPFKLLPQLPHKTPHLDGYKHLFFHFYTSSWPLLEEVTWSLRLVPGQCDGLQPPADHRCHLSICLQWAPSPTVYIIYFKPSSPSPSPHPLMSLPTPTSQKNLETQEDTI